MTGVDRKSIRRLALGPSGREPNYSTLATGSTAEIPSPDHRLRH
ncbi:MAG: hypothetical protein V4578_12100 [Pseudomonadota bacterium]